MEKRHQFFERKECAEASTYVIWQEVGIKANGCKYEKKYIARDNKINQFPHVRIKCMNWK